MRAVITLTMYAEVTDHDNAAALAADAEKGVRLNMESTLEQHGLSQDEVVDQLGILGVSYWLLPEAA